MAYVAPAGMAALKDLTTQDWILTHLEPNDTQMELLMTKDSGKTGAS